MTNYSEQLPSIEVYLRSCNTPDYAMWKDGKTFVIPKYFEAHCRSQFRVVCCRLTSVQDKVISFIRYIFELFR
jgi:hypothetical protein